MKKLTNISPVWPLRIGLGLVFLYSGTSIIAQPMTWAGFLPSNVYLTISSFMPVEVYMRIQGGGELLMGMLLLIWFTPRWLLVSASGLAAFEMLGILTIVGIDQVTFRDLGLLGASLSLVLFLLGNKKRV